MLTLDKFTRKLARYGLETLLGYMSSEGWRYVKVGDVLEERLWDCIAGSSLLLKKVQ